MIKIIFALLFPFLLNATDAQQHLVTSIKKELQQPMADSNRVISMMRLVMENWVMLPVHTRLAEIPSGLPKKKTIQPAWANLSKPGSVIVHY
jgi:hypothetical protein